MKDFVLFPGFETPPNRVPTEAETALARLRAKYMAMPEVQRERCYGAVRNWSLFKNYVEWLRAEIALWKANQRQHASLTALAWHVAGEVYNRDGLKLMDFNEHHQRCYLRNGLIALCKLLCDEVDERNGGSKGE